MADLAGLKARFDKALAKLEAQSAAAGEGGDLAAENAKLRAELEALKAERERDVSELNQLLAELGPMIEREAQNG
ncbi:hypothetical protein ACMA5I_05300 [Paracoccaceae bacterium GXU_MW_L88]